MDERPGTTTHGGGVRKKVELKEEISMVNGVTKM